MPDPAEGETHGRSGWTERLRDESDHLRNTSNRLLAHIEDLHALERQSRSVPIGSSDFARLSARITVLSHDVARLAGEQEEAGERLPELPTTLDEMDGTGSDDSRLRSA
jgi:hypothetical protein